LAGEDQNSHAEKGFIDLEPGTRERSALPRWMHADHPHVR
jgi:hypothetical protein